MDNQGKHGTLLDPNVRALIALHGLNPQPILLRYKDLGYDADQCHVSALHRAQTAGGERVLGWALWSFSELALAEFHSVWRTPEGSLVDLTPPKFGESFTFFIEDPTLAVLTTNHGYAMPTDLSSVPDMPHFFRGNPVRYTHWPLSPSAPFLADYCQRLGMDSAAIF